MVDLDTIWNLVQRQQGQLELLTENTSALKERLQAVQECLEIGGTLRQESVAARLHRDRFQQVLRQHPLGSSMSLESLVQLREMTLSLAKYFGPFGTASISLISQKFRRSIREVQSGLAAFFSPAIYVVGGEGIDEDVTSGVEKLSPDRIDWEPVAQMPSPRAYCAATALAGRVYVVGGLDGEGSMLRAVERFDPYLNQWEAMPSMQVARVAVAAAALGSMLCVVGGNNDVLVHDSWECLEPEAEPRNWVAMPRMRSPRWAAAAAAIGKHLHVVGGRDADDEVLSAVERFDPDQGRWTQLPPLRTPRASFAAAALGGKLYVVGGYDTTLQDLRSLERYDPETAAWQQLSPMTSPRFALGAIACSGCLYVLGGAVGDVDRVVLGTVECFDPRSDSWSSIRPLRMPRRRFGVAACC